MSQAKLATLPVTLLQRGCFQPRQYFDPAALQELAQSIREQGLIEPIVVRPVADQRYEIIAGERRWRAAQLAGLHELPCLINHYADQQALAVSLIENIQRQDLSVIEEAQGYQRLVQEFHFHHHDVAQMVGKSRSHISNMIRLLSLSLEVQQALQDQQVSMGLVKPMIGLSEADQSQLLNQAIAEDWSARRMEKAIQALKSTEDAPAASLPGQQRDVQRLQTLIAEQLGTQTDIDNQGSQGGWLKIRFYDNDTLAGVLDRLGVRYDEVAEQFATED